MLFGHFKNVDDCALDSPKLVHFGGFDMCAATFLESPSNMDIHISPK